MRTKAVPFPTASDIAMVEIDAMRARIAELERALRPFAAAVYNDNGDVTITTSRIDHDDWFRAYKVYKKTAK